jgi:Tfp pilus assembly protein PilO
MATHTRILPAMDRKMTRDRKMPAAGKRSSLQFKKMAYAYRENSNDTISDSKF